MLALLAIPAVLATALFDPASPEVRFEGAETYTRDGETRLWSAIERLRDPDPTLFAAEDWNSAMEWPSEASWAPWIDTCFGTQRPESSSFLLHIGLNDDTSSGTPILFVPGAGDNGSRAFVTLASHMDTVGRPVYALTFAHPQGDALLQAEIVADAIARIRYRTGAPQVDVVGHSKGGVVAALHASNAEGTTWGNTSFEARSTPYEGEIRRLVLVGTPLDGIDTAFRWTGPNLASLVADTALTPTSWDRYYPYGIATSWVFTDLGAQDHLQDTCVAGTCDLFPGQRQLLRRQDHPLPGALPWLGVYAFQQDWWTTYEGGWGYVSYASGIDAAIDAGGNLMHRLQENGVDPDVSLFLLAGTNPIMPNGAEQYWATFFGQTWLDLVTAGTDLWAALLAAAVGDTFAGLGFTEEELAGLASGDLMLGEISGESDGVVFTDSALHADTLTARGASVVQTRTVNLSHLDLLYASPVTGDLMIAEADAHPLENAWMRSLGERYTEADTIGWIEAVLADDPEPDDTAGEDTGSDPTPDTGTPTGGKTGGCNHAPLLPTWLPTMLVLLGIKRRSPWN